MSKEETKDTIAKNGYKAPDSDDVVSKLGYKQPEKDCPKDEPKSTTILCDANGNPIGPDNPLPTTGTVTIEGDVNLDLGDLESAIENLGDDIVAAIEDGVVDITAALQTICDKLEAGITVNAVQSGEWLFTIDADSIQAILDGIADALAEAEISLSADTIAELVAALEAADLTVTVDGGTITVDGSVELEDLQALLDALQAIVDALDDLEVTITELPDVNLSADTIADLIAALEAADLNVDVNISGQDITLDVNITNDPLTVELGQDTLDALADLTLMVEIKNEDPIEITGSVTIDGDVSIDWTGLQDALNGLEVEVTNFSDLTDLIDAMTISVTLDGETVNVELSQAQIDALADTDDTDDDIRPVAVQGFCYEDASGQEVQFMGYATVNEDGSFAGYVATQGDQPPANAEIQTVNDKKLCVLADFFCGDDDMNTDLDCWEIDLGPSNFPFTVGEGGLIFGGGVGNFTIPQGTVFPDAASLLAWLNTNSGITTWTQNGNKLQVELPAPSVAPTLQPGDDPVLTFVPCDDGGTDPQVCDFSVEFKSSGITSVLTDKGEAVTSGPHDFTGLTAGQNNTNDAAMGAAAADIQAFLNANGGGAVTLAYNSQSILTILVTGTTCVLQTADDDSNPGPHSFIKGTSTNLTHDDLVTSNFDPDRGSRWDQWTPSGSSFTLTDNDPNSGWLTNMAQQDDQQIGSDALFALARIATYNGPPGQGTETSDGYVLVTANQLTVSGSTITYDPTTTADFGPCTNAEMITLLTGAGFSAADASDLVNGGKTASVNYPTTPFWTNGDFVSGTGLPFGTWGKVQYGYQDAIQTAGS